MPVYFKRKKYTLALLLAWTFGVSTQTIWSQSAPTLGYQPAKTLSETLPSLMAKLNARLESDLVALPKANRNFLAKEYKERVDSLKSELLQENFLQDSLWNPWFQRVLSEILRSNPEISASDITLLLSRYESPNARCVGEGTLIFNIALLPYLDNESQVVFILCHELAHYHNNHGNQALHQYINTLYSPEVQKQLKEIVKGKYNKTERALEIMKSMAYKGSRHSRFKESEADSLGLVFLSRTGYRMQEVIKALQILDSIDQVRWPRIPYDTLFQSAGFPFQKSWLEQKGFGGGFSGQAPVNTGSSEFNLDSLKTHPDCPQRIELTKKQLEKMPQKEGSTFLQAESWFKTLQQSTPYEMVEGLYDRGYYGRSLFRTLVLLCNKREDVYLNTMVIKNLYEICQFQRSHRLRYVVDQPDREYSAEYNRFLKFINQFRVSDLEQMTFHFYHERKDNYPDSEDFAFATVLACSLKGLGPEFDTSLEHYLHTYPNGKYLDALKDLKH